MAEKQPSMAHQVARIASVLQFKRTGHTPKSVTVVLSKDTMVITMHGALSPAEQAAAASPEGAAKVQEYHRQLFATSASELRKELKRITGVDVREAAAEIETKTGTVVHAFTSGAMVQVFLMADDIATETWSGDPARDTPLPVETA